MSKEKWMKMWEDIQECVDIAEDEGFKFNDKYDEQDIHDLLNFITDKIQVSMDGCGEDDYDEDEFSSSESSSSSSTEEDFSGDDNEQIL